MVDFVKATATAQRLITKNGRSVTFVEFNSTLQNASRPWLGSTDPRVTPDSTLTIDAVFVEPDSFSALGLGSEVSDIVKKSTQIMIVSPGTSVDLRAFQEVIDGTTRWKITEIQTLRPSAEIVLGFVGVAE